MKATSIDMAWRALENMRPTVCACMGARSRPGYPAVIVLATSLEQIVISVSLVEDFARGEEHDYYTFNGERLLVRRSGATAWNGLVFITSDHRSWVQLRLFLAHDQRLQDGPEGRALQTLWRGDRQQLDDRLPIHRAAPRPGQRVV